MTFRNAFFDNDVTTLTTGEPWHVEQGQNIVVIYPRNDTTAGTTEVRTIYRVQRVYSTYPTRVDVTPVSMFDLSFEGPTKWEVNREAAIAGGRALEKKHRRPPKQFLRARTGFQQMARIPCYRGVRPR